MASTAYAKALESASFPKFVSTTVQLDSAQDLTLTLCPGLSTKLKQSNTYDTPRDPQREAVAIREAMAKATGEPPVSMRASVTRVGPVLAQPSGCAASSSRGVGRDATPSQVEYVVMQHKLGRDQGGTDRASPINTSECRVADPAIRRRCAATCHGRCCSKTST